MRRLASLVLALGTLTACGPSEPPQVIVRHRCGDVNFGKIDGVFGKLQGENGVNGKFRVKFERRGEDLYALWVPGGFGAHELKAAVESDDVAVFTETGSGERLRMKASISNDCRVEVKKATVSASGSETESAEPAEKYVPFPDLVNRDFEPCTETLYTGAAAKSWSAAQRFQVPDEPPVTRSSNMPVAAWSSKDEVGPGCEASFDLWTDGQSMEVVGGKTVEEKDGRLRWYHPYENDFLGLHGVAMHRKVSCPGQEPKLLGVACLQVEVK